MTQTQIPVGWASIRIKPKAIIPSIAHIPFDCILNNPHMSQPVVDQLERVIAYLDAQRRAIGNDSDNPLYWTLDDACNLVGETQDELAECDCDKSGNRNRNDTVISTHPATTKANRSRTL